MKKPAVVAEGELGVLERTVGTMRSTGGCMRYLWLDGFRGVAAIAVVLWHFRGQLGIPGFDFGYLAVDLFFVLSGIVLTPRFAPEIERGGISFGSFAWQRLRRLYPMALIAGLSVAALNASGTPAAFATTSCDWSVFALVPCPASNELANAFPADPPEWSLSAELICNGIWFAVLKRGRRQTATTFVACAFVFIAVAVLRHNSLDMGARAGFVREGLAVIRAMAGFGLGYFIYGFRLRPKIGAAAAIGLFLVACAAFQIMPTHPVAMGLLIIAAGATMLAALMESEPQSYLPVMLCRNLGRLSFPLYMIHAPAERLAYLLHDKGANVYVAYSSVLVGAGVLATVLNEAVVRSLPVRLRISALTKGGAP